jgi:hypothetical protein
MDNEEIITIDGVEYHFKLKSQKIVELEKVYGKNIFQIFEDMSFGTILKVLEASLVSPAGMDGYELMDKMLTKYTILELAQSVLKNIAVKSGLLRKSDVSDVEDNPKN